MNPQQNIPLDPTTLPLRDIHLPDAVSWWPLAVGWWLLLALLIITAIALVYLRRKQLQRRRSPVYLARKSLEQIKTEYAANGNKLELVKNLSTLLRRTVITLNPREDTAALTGHAWLRYLDKYMEGKPFSEGPGQILVTLPYQANINVEIDSLLQLVDEWCQSLRHKSFREAA